MDERLGDLPKRMGKAYCTKRISLMKVPQGKLKVLHRSMNILEDLIFPWHIKLDVVSPLIINVEDVKYSISKTIQHLTH